MIIHNWNRIWLCEAVYRFKVEENTIKFAKSSRKVGVGVIVLLDFLLSISNMTHRFPRDVLVTITFPLD